MTETAAHAETAAPSSTGRTIARLWLDAVAEERDRTGYLVEDEPGAWREVSWGEAARAVDELAHGLLSLGIRKGEAFGILASTRLEWVLFDFALALVGAVGAPAYATGSARDCAYILEHSDAVGVLAEALATSDVPGGVVNILTGLKRELAPVLAAHMDVNALDLAGVDGDVAELERAAAANVKRVVHGAADAQSPWEVLAFLELKTVWHPIGV